MHKELAMVKRRIQQYGMKQSFGTKQEIMGKTYFLEPNYMKAVKSSKSYETKATAYLTGTGISIFAIEVAILANAAFPPSTIVTIVCGLFNGVAIYKAVDNLVDSYEKWQDAREYYNVIKTYGTKR